MVIAEHSVRLQSDHRLSNRLSPAKEEAPPERPEGLLYLVGGGTGGRTRTCNQRFWRPGRASRAVLPRRVPSWWPLVPSRRVLASSLPIGVWIGAEEAGPLPGQQTGDVPAKDPPRGTIPQPRSAAIGRGRP